MLLNVNAFTTGIQTLLQVHEFHLKTAAPESFLSVTFRGERPEEDPDAPALGAPRLCTRRMASSRPRHVGHLKTGPVSSVSKNSDIRDSDASHNYFLMVINLLNQAFV